MGFEQPVEAEFNSGLALIYQLDAIEKALIQATIDQNYHKHYRLLVAYFKSLTNQANEKQEEEQLKYWDVVYKNYKFLCETQRKGKNKVPEEVIQSFDWWEIKLRNLKQKLGLGMPKKDPRYSGTR